MPVSGPEACLLALDRGSAECIPGVVNRMPAFTQRVMPESWMRRTTAKATKNSLADPVK